MPVDVTTDVAILGADSDAKLEGQAGQVQAASGTMTLCESPINRVMTDSKTSASLISTASSLDLFDLDDSVPPRASTHYTHGYFPCIWSFRVLSILIQVVDTTCFPSSTLSFSCNNSPLPSLLSNSLFHTLRLSESESSFPASVPSQQLPWIFSS